MLGQPLESHNTFIKRTDRGKHFHGHEQQLTAAVRLFGAFHIWLLPGFSVSVVITFLK